MSIHIATTALVYVVLLVLTYEAVIFTSSNEEKSEEVINKAYHNAYSILMFGLFVTYTLVQIPLIYLDSQTASYLLLTSKFISVLTLGGSLFILNRKID